MSAFAPTLPKAFEHLRRTFGKVIELFNHREHVKHLLMLDYVESKSGYVSTDEVTTAPRLAARLVGTWHCDTWRVNRARGTTDGRGCQ